MAVQRLAVPLRCSDLQGRAVRGMLGQATLMGLPLSMDFGRPVVLSPNKFAEDLEENTGLLVVCQPCSGLDIYACASLNY